MCAKQGKWISWGIIGLRIFQWLFFIYDAESDTKRREKLNDIDHSVNVQIISWPIVILLIEFK